MILAGFLVKAQSGEVQRSVLGKRLDFCMTLSLYISFFSALFNAIQLMDDDNLELKTLRGASRSPELEVRHSKCRGIECVNLLVRDSCAQIVHPTTPRYAGETFSYIKCHTFNMS